MKETGSWGGVAVILCFIAFCVFLVSVFTYAFVVSYVCNQLGWTGGGAHDGYGGYCVEYNEERWQRRECDLARVLAGDCKPMWSGAE